MSRRRRAFTLVELLVVIGIMAVLIAMLLPALNRAREQSRRIRCLSNMRQLTIAWSMYANDSKGRICGANTPVIGTDPKEFNWVTVDTNGMDTLASLQAGMLYKYVNTAEVYHCPSIDYIRSYSLNSLLLGEGPEDQNTGKIYKHLSEIRKPHATFVFIEEWDPRKYLINSFMVLPYAAPGTPAKYNIDQWVDIPAPQHGRVGLLSFADGHAIMWPWSDPMTWKRNGQFNTVTPNNPDLRDLQGWRGPGGVETPPNRAW